MKTILNMEQLTDFQKFAGGDAQYKWTSGEHKGNYETYNFDDKTYIYFTSGIRIKKSQLEQDMVLVMGTQHSNLVKIERLSIQDEPTNDYTPPPPEEILYPTTPSSKKISLNKITDGNLVKFKKLLSISNSETKFTIECNLPSDETMIMMEILEFDWKLLFKKHLNELIQEKLDEI
jgi:hypothetical protein